MFVAIALASDERRSRFRRPGERASRVVTPFADEVPSINANFGADDEFPKIPSTRSREDSIPAEEELVDERRKLRREQEEEVDQQARNAFYYFQSDIKDGIKDGQHQREEKRDGLQVCA